MNRGLEDFIWYLQGEKRFSKNTVESYRFDLKFWMGLGLDPEALGPPTPEDFDQMLDRFSSTDLAPASRSRRISSLRLFIRYRSLLAAQHADEWLHRLSLTPKIREEVPLPKSLALSQIENFLDFDPAADLSLLRDRALFEVIYASGLRISEALGLTWSVVRFSEELLLVQGKGSKERWVPSSRRALNWLQRFREQAWEGWSEGAPRKFRDHVFLSARGSPLTRMGAWKAFHRRSLISGIDDVHPHVLRHSFATHLLQGGADVRAVQMLLGHQSLTTTERYLKIDDQELKKLFAEFHPLR
jgi:integrase/recombinase XerD